MPDRRTLEFARLDDVMPEVDRLLAGHTTVGNWSLGQICNHLTRGIISSVEGAPERAPWLVRKTIGPWILKWVLKTGQIPAGIKLPKQHEPKPGLDPRAEAEALRASLQCLAAHHGPLADHSFGGRISRT